MKRKTFRGTLGQCIHVVRKDRGMFQRELGKLVGSYGQQVSLWEAGGRLPRTDTLLKLSVALLAVFSAEGHNEAWAVEWYAN